MLLAEDLLLLVTDDAGGRLCVPAADAGLGGANLLELALMDRAVGCGWRDVRLVRHATLCPPGGHRCHAEQGYLRVPLPR